MRSWVRYSVSAYLGLLLAGSIASPGADAPVDESVVTAYPRPVPVPMQLVPIRSQPNVQPNSCVGHTES